MATPPCPGIVGLCHRALAEILAALLRVALGFVAGVGLYVVAMVLGTVLQTRTAVHPPAPSLQELQRGPDKPA